MFLQSAIDYELEVLRWDPTAHRALLLLLEECPDAYQAEGMLAGKDTRLAHRGETHVAVSVDLLGLTLSLTRGVWVTHSGFRLELFNGINGHLLFDLFGFFKVSKGFLLVFLCHCLVCLIWGRS